MKMKVKNFMMLLALTGFAASCSNDDLVKDGPDGGSTLGGRSEIQLAFSGTGESEEYERSARAIASESENRIDQLSVYLFASDAADGTYYFLEKWEEGAAYDANTNPTGFKKQESGTGWKASIYPHELKGMPYVKLFCVANNKTDGATTDGKFYAEDGTTEVLNSMTAVTVDADGKVTNAAAATAETAFKKAYSKALDVTVANGIIGTPLLMTGEGQTKISGSVSKVNIDLHRIMARFDIDNTASRSNLTIETISMAHGRKTGGFFKEAVPTLVEKANLDADLFTYQPIDFTNHTGANQGLAESAIYVYPTLATDESYLIVEGTYKSPITSQQVPVTYNIPIVRTDAATNITEYIAIKANSRYKLRITDVTQSNIFGTFEVVDWTSGGGINVKPDNDAPVFDADAAFGGANEPTPLTKDGEVYGYEVTGTDGAGSFDITIAATGKVRAEKSEVSQGRAAADIAWLTIDDASTYKEENGVWYTTFTLSYTDAIGQQPVAVTFINDAASYDPALWTVINFYGPKAIPSFVAQAASIGNTTDVTTAPAAPTASMYAVNNSFVTFDITSIEGVTVEATALAAARGYKVELLKSEGFVHTYKVSVSDVTQVEASATIKFQNSGDITKEAVLTITKLDPAMTASTVTADAAVTADFTAGELKVDLDVLNTYTFKVESAKGASISDEALAACTWLTFTKVDTWQDADGSRYDSYSVTKKAGATTFEDCTLTFENKLSNSAQNISAPSLALKFKKDYSKPKLAMGTTTDSWSTFNQGLANGFTDPYAATFEMYLVANSAVTVKMSCTEAAAFDAVEGLTIAETSVNSGEYVITVNDAAKFIAGNTTTLTAYNTPAKTADPSTDRKATLTITWKSAEITDTLTDDGDGVVVRTVEGNNVVYTLDSSGLAAKGFKFSVTANGGATTDLSVFGGDTNFLMKHTGNTGTGDLAAGVAQVYQLKNNDETQKTDITMTFTNKITGGKNLVIVFKNTYTAP